MDRGSDVPGNLLLPSLRVTTKLDFDPHIYEPDGPETSLPMNLGSGAGVSALGAKATWIGLHPPQSLLYSA